MQYAAQNVASVGGFRRSAPASDKQQEPQAAAKKPQAESTEETT